MYLIVSLLCWVYRVHANGKEDIDFRSFGVEAGIIIRDFAK